MKKIVILMIFTKITFAFAQSNEIVDCKLIPQKRTLWCWAASLQMIDNNLKHYKSDTLSQCKIVETFVNQLKINLQKDYEKKLVEYNKILKQKKKGPPPDPERLPSKPLPSPTLSIPFTFCDSMCKISLNKNLANYSIQKADYKTILDLMGYDFIDSPNYIYSQIQTQIDLSQPMILRGIVGDKSLIPGIWDGHAVVIKGYWESDGLPLIKINDPWEMCKGCSYYLNYQLTRLENCEVNYEKSSVIHNIQAKTTLKTKILEEVQKKDKEVAFHWVSSDTEVLVRKSLINMIKSNNIKSLNEFGLSNKDTIKIKNDIFYKRTINNILFDKLIQPEIKNVFSEHIDTISTNLLYCYESMSGKNTYITILNQTKNCKYFYIESISSDCWWTKAPSKEVKVVAENRNISTKDYSIVKSYPLQFSFYKITEDNKTYLIPQDDYFETLGLKANYAYSDSIILGKLKKYANTHNQNFLRL